MKCVQIRSFFWSNFSRIRTKYREILRFLWTDHLFRTFEKNIFPCFFFEKDHFLFSVLRIKSYFREKEISSFLIIQKRSYSNAIFLEIPSFQSIWRKRVRFFVQCESNILEQIHFRATERAVSLLY